MRFNKFLAERKSEQDILKKNRTPLDPEEREKVMKAGAVWHNHPDPKKNPIPAVWKSKNSKGDVKYCCNTHRAIQIKDTLKGAIKSYDFIKTTA